MPLMFGLLAGDLSKMVPLMVDARGRVVIAPDQRVPLGHECFVAPVSGAPASLTPPPGAKCAVVQADGAPLSITLDGVLAPTATVGRRIDDGGELVIDSDLTKVRIFGRGTANVQITYFDRP